MAKFIVDGTTIKHGGKHYADGSVIELPADVAKNLRVRLPEPPAEEEKPAKGKK